MDTQDAITDVFNGTILEDPALGLVYVRPLSILSPRRQRLIRRAHHLQCLVGSKVDAVSSALTWLHTHAHLSLPTVSPSLLTLSQNQTDELTASLTDPESAVSAPSIADRMIDAYRRSLEQQRTAFVLAVGIWALVLVMGLVGVWWRAAGERAWRRWRGGYETDDSDALDEKVVVPGGFDEEKRAFFKPLHLRSASSGARGGSEAAPAPPQAPSTHPYGVAHGANPSAASWASLIEYFAPTPAAPSSDNLLAPPAAAPAAASPDAAAANDPPRTRRSPRTLVLPSFPSLPSLRRTPATPSSPPTSRPRALAPRRPLISRPSRPLSAFRSLRDSHFAAGVGAAAGAGASRRRRESDCAPLRGVEAAGERRYALPGGARPGEAEGRGARWRSRVAARMGGGGRRRDGRGAGQDDDDEEGWEEMRDEDDDTAGPGVLPLYPPLPPTHASTLAANPFADPLGAARTLYAPSSRPPVVPVSARAVNPFATPFDGEGER